MEKGTFAPSSEEQAEAVQRAIFDLVVHIVDKKGDNLSKADVTLLWINGTKISSRSTNSTGYVLFENMPSTTFLIKGALNGYRDHRIEVILANESQMEVITLQSIPFVKIPLGLVTNIW